MPCSTTHELHAYCGWVIASAACAFLALAPFSFAAGTTAIKPLALPTHSGNPAAIPHQVKVLIKQASPEVVGAGAKRAAEIRAQHRSWAELAKHSKQTADVLSKPYVYSVNDQQVSNAWIVPGAPYVFKGRGFGAIPGTMKLVGNFPHKAPTFRIDLWQDGTIHAYLEDDITGAYDQEGIQLLIAAGNVQIVKQGVRFYAARETRPIDLRPYRDVIDNPPFAASRQITEHDSFIRVEGSETRTVPSTGAKCLADGSEARGGGLDIYRLPNLKAGWLAVGYEYYVGPSEQGPGDHAGGPGRREMRGKYQLAWHPPEINMWWATFNSFSDAPCGTADQLWSYTAYEIRAFIEGPRGTKAF